MASGDVISLIKAVIGYMHCKNMRRMVLFMNTAGSRTLLIFTVTETPYFCQCYIFGATQGIYCLSFFEPYTACRVQDTIYFPHFSRQVQHIWIMQLFASSK